MAKAKIEEEEVEQEEVVVPDPAKLSEDFQILGHCRLYPEFANIHAYVYEDLLQANVAFGQILSERRKAEAEEKAAAEAEAAAKAKYDAEVEAQSAA